MPNDLKNKLNRFYDTYNDNRCSGLCQDLLRRSQIRKRINDVHYPDIAERQLQNLPLTACARLCRINRI